MHSPITKETASWVLLFGILGAVSAFYPSNIAIASIAVAICIAACVIVLFAQFFDQRANR
jgi:hypothetical protein